MQPLLSGYRGETMRIKLALITIILIVSVFFLVLFPDTNSISGTDKYKNIESTTSASK